MSYDIHFMKLRRPVARVNDIEEGNVDPIDTVAATRVRLDALFPDGVEWFDDRNGRTRAIEWARWSLLQTKDGASVIWVTLETSYRIPSEERYELAQRVADATGWTAIDLQGGAKREMIVPCATAVGRSCTD